MAGKETTPARFVDQYNEAMDLLAKHEGYAFLSNPLMEHAEDWLACLLPADRPLVIAATKERFRALGGIRSTAETGPQSMRRVNVLPPGPLCLTGVAPEAVRRLLFARLHPDREATAEERAAALEHLGVRVGEVNIDTGAYNAAIGAGATAEEIVDGLRDAVSGATLRSRRLTLPVRKSLMTELRSQWHERWYPDVGEYTM